MAGPWPSSPPPRPWIVSLPPKPTTQSGSGVPFSTSSFAVPEIVFKPLCWHSREAACSAHEYDDLAVVFVVHRLVIGWALSRVSTTVCRRVLALPARFARATSRFAFTSRSIRICHRACCDRDLVLINGSSMRVECYRSACLRPMLLERSVTRYASLRRAWVRCSRADTNLRRRARASCGNADDFAPPRDVSPHARGWFRGARRPERVKPVLFWHSGAGAPAARFLNAREA